MVLVAAIVVSSLRLLIITAFYCLHSSQTGLENLFVRFSSMCALDQP